MERRISTLILLSLVLSDVGALTTVIKDELYEYARGDNITLPCTYTTKIQGKPKLIQIAWSVKDASLKEIQIASSYNYEDGTSTLDVKKAYEGRVTMDVDTSIGKGDLKLKSITAEDSKTFECRVQIPGDDEGKPADTTRLVVLVAPSKPICKIQGKVEYGQNINLTCKSEEGTPKPTYSWESRDVRNTLRPQAPRTVDKEGILSLFNISKEASGFYICTSKNKIRQATCNVTVAVMPPSMNIGSTAGIIGGVVAALIALIVIIYCCCCRKKKKEEEYAMGVREEEAYTDKEPDRNGDSRRADGEEGYDSSVRRTSADRYEERSERNYDDRQSDYDDHRSDYDNRNRDNRRRDYDDHPGNYDDRHSDYDDRRSNYTDRRDKYSDRSDRNERYDDERGREDDRRYDDRDRRYDDRYEDRYEDRYDDRNRDRPPAPTSKPPRDDYDD